MWSDAGFKTGLFINNEFVAGEGGKTIVSFLSSSRTVLNVPNRLTRVRTS